MPSFADLQNHFDELIRKGLQGSVFVAPMTVTDAITALVDANGLLALPPGYTDVGRITKGDGVSWTRDVSSSDTESLGASQPTRRDITSDVTGLQFTMQESKRAVFELHEGQDLSAVTQSAGPAAPGVNEVQTVTISGGPTGGTITLTFDGQTTADIAYNATAATVESALEALSTIGYDNVTVTGVAGGPWTVEFVNDLGKTNVSQMAATSALTGGTSPSVAVSTTTQGSADSAYTSNVVWDKPDRPASIYYRTLALFKDGEGADAIYFAKWLPRAQVTDRGEQAWNEDSEIQYPVTLTAFVDRTAGTSVRTLWGGPGSRMTDMGFAQP
jgi:hypothetical protein